MLRLHLGMTQKAFSELIGVSKTTVAFIETGQRPISALTRAKLAKTFEINDDFLTFAENFNKITHFNSIAMDAGGQAENEDR
ncbi:helix-turn-helix domain-containing protein [Priestia flexa]|uniref:helix-turn-helix domain-containing protein n=1 Tax=Priestia flexa TaxID=86664 RepID=UPI0021BD365C|nr:helix-turn-helix transcriptional regulator [Priestia flexa]